MKYYLPVNENDQSINIYEFNKQYYLNNSNIDVYWTASCAINPDNSYSLQQNITFVHISNIINTNFHYKQTIINDYGNVEFTTIQGVNFPQSHFTIDTNNKLLIQSDFCLIQPLKYICGDSINTQNMLLYNDEYQSTINSNYIFSVYDEKQTVVGIWIQMINSLILFGTIQFDFQLILNSINHVNEYEIYCIIPSSQFNNISNYSSYDQNGSRIKQQIIPYITGIGLYNDAGQLLALSKLSYPVRKSNKIDMIFNIQFDFV